jgi:hypothetical protein
LAVFDKAIAIPDTEVSSEYLVRRNWKVC